MALVNLRCHCTPEFIVHLSDILEAFGQGLNLLLVFVFSCIGFLFHLLQIPFQVPGLLMALIILCLGVSQLLLDLLVVMSIPI